VILATFQRLSDHAGTPGRLGAVDRASATVLDLQAAQKSLSGREPEALRSMLALIEAGEPGMELARSTQQRAAGHLTATSPLHEVRLLAPVPVPAQMRDFLVFEKHIRGAGAAMAKLRAERTGSTDPLPTPAQVNPPETFFRQPIYYKTNRFSVVGHEHEVRWPSYSRKFDYELELGIFLAKKGKNIRLEDAAGYIFGYTIFNDFSARDAQEYEMACPLGPAKGKDFDTGNVIGPWIVTPDEIPDPRQLTMTASINGEVWSRGNTRDMVHGFERMIAHVSREETLYPGEFFGSGTVGGGCGLELDRWLQPGDTVELEIEHIGKLRNRVVREDDAIHAL
jgi:2-keto-4-pentenoate hydratase/2-oxohepta-3-ene-1,7-dioic acid hydratase in catechol pathway